MIISITGFMGCGKSSVGRKLSELLCCRFMDLDTAIEEKAGKSIPVIFATEGEKVFRKLEKDTLTEIICSESGEDDVNLILALGGGAVMTPECEKTVHESTFCIYLRASVDTLMDHLYNDISSRPLLADSDTLRERITSMMKQRSATYERTAHHQIDTDGKSIDKIAAEILDTVKF